MRNRKIIIVSLALLFLAAGVSAQTGGAFTITQSVIANGGGQQSAGGSFSLDGTIGQSLAGDNSSGGMFGVRGGFWASQLAPTAAGASVSGRVRGEAGKGIRNVQLTLTSAATGEVFYAHSGIFGFYRFENLAVGEGYILTVSAKRFTFNPNTIFISLLGDLTVTDFIGTAELGVICPIPRNGAITVFNI